MANKLIFIRIINISYRIVIDFIIEKIQSFLLILELTRKFTEHERTFIFCITAEDRMNFQLQTNIIFHGKVLM